MQVDHLFVIVFTHESTDEAALSGKYLLDKARTKEPLSKILIHVDTRTPASNWAGSKTQAGKRARRGEMLKAFAERKFAVGVKVIEGSIPEKLESKNVGVYLVFHCSKNGVPKVFDFAYDLGGEVPLFKEPDRVAAQFVRILQEFGPPQTLSGSLYDHEGQQKRRARVSGLSL